jgi:hypothetical protein
VDTFSLALDATGTVIAVDSSPASSIGEAAIREALTAGYEIVAGSIEVTVGDGTVAEDGTIRIPVQATARQTRPIDAAALRAKVLGMSEADARAALAAYGAVDVVLWPGWVTSIPTTDGRVTLTVNAAVQPAAPSPSASPSASPSPHRSASPAPTHDGGPTSSARPSSGSPVPSG